MDSVHIQPASGDADSGVVGPEAILALGTGYFTWRAVLTATELGLFTHLADGPATCEQLQQRLELHARGARDFLDGLVSLGLLHRTDGQYRNSLAANRFLDRDKASYLGSFLEMADARWRGLSDALRTGQPQNGTRAGSAMFAQQYRSTQAWRRYMVGMDALNGPIGPALAGQFNWAEVTSFTDVGGARGNVAAALVSAHPNLTATVFDLPPVQSLFDEHISPLGLESRIRFQGGDFFHESLPASDVLIFGHVLHDWGLPEREQLLKKAFDALPPGGAVIVYDPMIDDDRRGTAANLLVSLNMLVGTPAGGEYTASDCAAWLTGAGFTGISAVRLTRTDSLVVGTKAG